MTLEEDNEKILRELKSSQRDIGLMMTAIESEFASLHREIATVDDDVRTNRATIVALATDVATFKQEFLTFVDITERRNNVTHAQGQVIILNQEIEKKFGLYDKVRKVLLGVLQSVDTGLVSKSVIVNSTEKLMISTPRYWLTPSLIAISAWLTDNQPLAIKALNEGLKRNQIKTQLMFTLVNNRLKRNKASFIWLSKYFENQNPLEMSQETIVLLNAYTDGFFGPDSHGICKKQIEKWINILARDEEKVKALEKIWYNKIDLLSVEADKNLPFRYLSKYSPDFTMLENLLNNAKKQTSFVNYLNSIIKAEITKIDYVKALDDLLYRLVNEYDSDEFDLKKQKSMAELIVKHQGDKEKAEQDFNTNVIILFNNHVSFFEILVNAVNSETTSASLKKFSLFLVKEWIANAHNDFTTSYRSKYPQSITIKIDDWTDTTKDGSNEKKLFESYKKYLKDKLDKLVKSLTTPIYISAVLNIICLLWIFLGKLTTMPVVCMIFVVIYFIRSVYFYFVGRSCALQEYNNNCQSGKTITSAFCAEFVDWQKAYKNYDAVYKKVEETLANYNANDFTNNNAEKKIL